MDNHVSQSPLLLNKLSAAIDAEKEFHFRHGFDAGAKAMAYFMREKNLSLEEALKICEKHLTDPMQIVTI